MWCAYVRVPFAEIIIDGDHMRTHPASIEAYFVNTHAEKARSVRRKHIAAHGVEVPLVKLDLDNWDEPFKCLEGCGETEPASA